MCHGTKGNGVQMGSQIPGRVVASRRHRHQLNLPQRGARAVHRGVPGAKVWLDAKGKGVCAEDAGDASESSEQHCAAADGWPLSGQRHCQSGARDMPVRGGLRPDSMVMDVASGSTNASIVILRQSNASIAAGSTQGVEGGEQGKGFTLKC